MSKKRTRETPKSIIGIGKPIYRRLLAYLKPYRPQFGLAMLFMIVFAATDGVVPFLVKRVLDDVFASKSTAFLTIIPIVLMIFAVVRGASDFFQQYLMARVGHWIVRDLRNEVSAHLLRLSADFYAFRSTADLVSRVTSDVLLIRTLLTDAASAIIRDSIRVLALLSAAFYLDWRLALLAAVGFPIGVYPVYKFGKHLRRLSRAGQEAVGALSAIMQESSLGNRVVKIFAREDFEDGRFREANRGLTKTFIKSEKYRALTGPVNEVVAMLAIAAVILYGGYSVIHDLRSQGEFLAFLVSVFLLYDPFKKLSRVNSVVQQGVAGAERIFELLDTVSSVQESKTPEPLSDSLDIELDGVGFAYKGRPGAVGHERDAETWALQGINLSIKPGQRVALVGLSGAGKSTLVDLLPRFIDPTVGVVRLGGVDISKLRISDLRSRIAMVAQHTFLFHDSINSNIAYGKQGASQEEIIEAAKSAYAYDFIMRMPRGFDSIIGEGGSTLSGGERQRLAIARAILKNAPILILDEATASLDNQSEREVQSALEALEQGRTTIVIAHRLSTVRKADVIVVLKDGKIVEMGSHDELLKLGGEFSHLYSLQFHESVPQRTQQSLA